MKNIITTICLTIAILTAAFAQSPNQLFNFKSEKEADIMLKAISLEITLTPDEFSGVRSLLLASAKNTAEVLNTEEGKKADAEQMIVVRQNAHVETNLETILGQDKYNLFLQKREAIQIRYAELSR